MPLYEYECTACHKHTEKIQKFSDKEITDCPFCGGKLQRVITAPAIAFKGGGWFKDGYGNAKPASSGASESSGADNSSAGNATPGEKPSGEKSPAGTSAPAAAATPATSPAPAASPSADKK